ncbi:hypothetical protein FLONG3_10845, partial [Fusarium longipes]
TALPGGGVHVDENYVPWDEDWVFADPIVSPPLKRKREEEEKPKKKKKKNIQDFFGASAAVAVDAAAAIWYATHLASTSPGSHPLWNQGKEPDSC